MQEIYKKLGKVVIDYNSIKEKIKEIACKIEQDYKNKEIVLIGNLKGAFRFLADLVSELNIPVIIDFIAFASYIGTHQDERIRIVKDLKLDIEGKEVIVVEDIIDTGVTMDYIIKYLKEIKGAKEVKICALLDKPSRRVVEVPIHYKGFEIDDIFVVGYGLDYNEYFRELNEVREFIE